MAQVGELVVTQRCAGRIRWRRHDDAAGVIAPRGVDCVSRELEPFGNPGGHQLHARAECLGELSIAGVRRIADQYVVALVDQGRACEEQCCGRSGGHRDVRRGDSVSAEVVTIEIGDGLTQLRQAERARVGQRSTVGNLPCRGEKRGWCTEVGFADVESDHAPPPRLDGDGPARELHRVERSDLLRAVRDLHEVILRADVRGPDRRGV